MVIQHDPLDYDSYWGRGNAYFAIYDEECGIADYREYGKITGHLEPFMVEEIESNEQIQYVEFIVIGTILVTIFSIATWRYIRRRP